MSVSRIKLVQQGPDVSRIVLGLWRLADWGMSRSELLDLIKQCLNLGITTFDHADIYGDYTCEQIFGEALIESPDLRQRMQIATKCGIKLVSKNRPDHRLKLYDTSRKHIITSVENSLQMLQTDYVDLLMIHRPDPFMDAEEVAEAFSMLHRSGKVRFFGVSNFLPAQFDLLSSFLDLPLVTNQIEISVAHLDAFFDGTLDLCQRLRQSPMAWSPFAGGAIFKSKTEKAVRIRQALQQVGEEWGGATMDEVALAWLLSHPAHIVPILGTGKLERIQRAVQAESLFLTREQWFAIWSASTGEEVP
ncbi:aldo/keto reductase [bacterium]|nr:aldo/keto reductase [bacterium]RQV95260.1 MAG: aldo/keto reductase family oxidoreductase [bacterium]